MSDSATLDVLVYTADAEAKRAATARSQMGPLLPGPGTPAVDNKDDLRTPLLAMRRSARQRLPELVPELRRLLELRGIDWLEARDADSALRHIATLAGDRGHVAINKSGVVYNELRPELLRRGFRVIDTYFDQFEAAPKAPRYHWELPDWRASRLGLSFSASPRVLAPAAELRPVVGILGVNAMAAEDGSVHFLEHFSNISRILAEAQHLLFVVPLDKIVPDRAAAALQVQSSALFGLDSILLDLQPRADKTAHRLEDLRLLPAGGTRTIEVLLLDNGRSALADGRHDALLDCIGCRACLRQCPTYPYFGGPTRRNPKEYLTYALAERQESLSQCTSCGMCAQECPVGIDIPFLIARHRSEGPMTLQRWVLARAELSARLASATAPLSNLILRQPVARWLLEKIVGIHHARNLPAFSRDSLPRWFQRRAPLAEARREVAYFGGCSANFSRTEVGRALVAILEHNGVRVTYPAQRCTGMPAFANGDFGLVRENAELNLRSLGAAAARGADIITTCTSCSLMLKKNYPLLLGERARIVAERVVNAEEYLLRLHREGQLRTDFQPLPRRVSYHVPCHLKAQGQEDMALELLRLIPGLEVSRMRGGCSGMSGTFGMKAQFFDQSMAIGAHMFAEIERPEVDVPATSCPTCQLQMDHGTRKPTVHPLLLLLEAYGLGKMASGQALPASGGSAQTAEKSNSNTAIRPKQA